MMEFHVSRTIRDECQFDLPLFSSNGNVVLANFKNVRMFAQKINETIDTVLHPEQTIKAGQLNAMGLIDEIFHVVCHLFRQQKNSNAFVELLQSVEKAVGTEKLNSLLHAFNEEFPPLLVYQGKLSVDEYLSSETEGVSNRVTTFEELMLLRLANENPAFKPFFILFNDNALAKNSAYNKAWKKTIEFFKTQPSFGPNNIDLISLLKEPVKASSSSLKGQLDYIRQHWADFLGEWLLRLLAGMDMIAEEEKPGWSGHFSGPPPMEAYNYDSLMKEYERFSPDREWMPRVVLMAKTVLVWLDQLSKKYERPITRLDQIPDEELDLLAQEGFTGLWLIGLWERSWASKRIKQINGNPEAAASAYSLHDYEIAQELGGWEALDTLRKKLWYRGIRIASDMVPNHTGMDSKWVVEKPQLFVQNHDCPFPTYSFSGENLSLDPRISVFLEDRYYSKTDCAVVYKRVDNNTGDTRYIYHGNDGTGMPWNDTAQIDFLNPEAREEVIQKILHVARNFPIIRFDAAMVLAKKHIRRLWYPEPGQGGDIASRAEHAISRDDFEKAIPNEFWREVVDRCAAELPDTLLLAEAFWMMEGYFVRTLGMHRVYNSAFMNMLKKEENYKYRSTVKNTLEFDPQVLKRFVNFMNNPDEETAVAQFGKGDKYFGVCTLMVTMPGLPMFGHGQIEGFSEKYGMEFTKAYWNENPDYELIDKHKRDIFPLMKKRYLFAEIEHFRFYDVWNEGSVNENIFAYSNCFGDEKAVVFYNNAYQQASGWIKTSCNYGVKSNDNGEEKITLKTQEFASAIGLDNSSDAYCIFQEQRTKLWFIRSAAELYEKGMYVYLNGFEYQVLLNISTVIDDKTKKYRILHDNLKGRGVPDIDVALQEIFLKDLYASLVDFATSEFFSDIFGLCMPQLYAKSLTTKKQKPITLTNFLKKIQEPALAFFAMLEKFIEGNYGFSSVIDQKKTGKKQTMEKIWRQFSARIKNLVFIATGEKGNTNEYSPLLKELYKGILERPFMCEILASYCILYTLRDIIGNKASAKDTKNLIALWCLDRKIADILHEFGKNSPEIYNRFKHMLEVTQFCDVSIDPKNPNKTAFAFLNTLVNDNNGRAILGVNLFNDIVWFNKEKAEETVWLTVMIYTLFVATPAAYPNVHRIWKLLVDAMNKSDYKIDSWLELLAPSKNEKVRTKKK